MSRLNIIIMPQNHFWSWIKRLCDKMLVTHQPRMSRVETQPRWNIVNSIFFWQGSEELFSVDPLPNRSSATPVSAATYIQQSRMADLGSADHGDQRQDDDDNISTGDAEVSVDVTGWLSTHPSCPSMWRGTPHYNSGGIFAECLRVNDNYKL